MRPSEALRANREALCALAEQHQLRNLRVFGSVAMGVDGDESDLDLLVDAPPGVTLFDLGGFQVRAAKLLGVSVDVVTAGNLPARLRGRVPGSHRMAAVGRLTAGGEAQ